MIYLFSQEGRQALEALAGRSILYAFDFDGTLAPISSDRDAVVIPQTIKQSLKALAARMPCAIVSGRSLDDLVPRVDEAVPYLIGNHGLESPFTPTETLYEARETCRIWMKDILRDSAALRAGGIDIEDKQYSVTFHYRHAVDVAASRTGLLKLLRELSPVPHVLFGKLSLNILPPGQRGKGEGVSRLMKHLRQEGVFYVGDEETDENVFETNDGLVVGVRVGRQKKSRAGYYLNHQGEVEDLLQFLVRWLK